MPDLYNYVQGNGCTYAQLYAGFAEYCNSFKGSINLCGISLGGILALNYAIQNPERVNSLVLIATQYKIPKLLFSVQNIVFRFIPKSKFNSLGISKRDLIELTKSMKQLDFTDNLPHVSCKTLVVYGEKDLPNKKASIKLAHNIKHTELRSIKSSQHEVNTQNPGDLAKMVDAFYSSLQEAKSYS